jgi:hypothetical protein
LIESDEDVVDIGILHYKFNTLDSAAVYQKLYFDTDSVLHENTRIATSLYAEKIAFVASPLKKEFMDTKITFRFRDLLWFDNTKDPIVELWVDFDDDNGLQQITDSLITIAYETFGIKILRFEAVLEDGTILVAYSTIDCEPYVSKSTTSQSGWQYMDYYDGKSGNNPPIEAKITPSNPYDGGTFSKAKGHVWIYYANADKKLHKPILIVDGFDPLNERNFESHKEKGMSIWQLLGNGIDDNLGRMLLEDKGYDLVILDLPEGGTYIERNAMVCIEVINFINQKLQESGSQHEIVVVGPSMGGQITRYALTYMEQNPSANTNYGKHNCRLWVSFDSPHQGANISIGTQALMEHLDGNGEQYKKIICSKAAQQMLIHHRESDANTIFQTYYNGLRGLNPATNGYPTELRKIAVANGSLNNTSNGVTGETVFRGTIWWTALALPGAGYTLDIRIRHVSNSGSTDVFVATHWVLLIPIIKRHSFTNNTGKCSPDAAPGGYFKTYDAVAKKLKKYGATISTNHNKHSFMPIPSVLDISGNMNYCTNIVNRDLVAEGITPFQSYWGNNSENMDHVEFNEDLVIWLTNEIETYNLPRNVNAPMCQIAKYSIHLPAGKENTPVTWATSHHFEIVSGQGTKTIHAKPLTTGQGWIAASPNNLEHSKTLKPFSVTITNSQVLDFTDEAITDNTTITNCDDINVKNVTVSNDATLTLIGININLENVIVQSGSKLILEASGEVTFGAGFDAQAGTEIETR